MCLHGGRSLWEVFKKFLHAVTSLSHFKLKRMDFNMAFYPVSYTHLTLPTIYSV